MPGREEIIATLGRGGPFASLGPTELRTLAHLLRVIHIEDGDVLFAEGDEAEAAFVVLEGAIDIVERGGRVRDTVEPGELFGELALFSSLGRRTAGAVARGRACLGAIAYEPFLAVVRAHPVVVVALLKLSTERFLALDRDYRRLRAGASKLSERHEPAERPLDEPAAARGTK
ncbi:MAG: cyclic nucleotide-binding domain-containing protein [Deltaproteobacteria bacterium]|nr:cyclic nucleotide-binding domain-containing protein [Deltaproteobacteria bacterium]